MVFNPFEPESEQEKADNARKWTIAEIKAETRTYNARLAAHIAKRQETRK